MQESGSEPVLQLTDLHGDVVATTALSPSETKLKATFSFDEFGNPISGEAGRFGWLGGKQRRTELPSGVIQMGARSYVPQLGRFLAPDPLRGGSANAYDYANQDPVNQFDLNGQCAKARYSDPCGKGGRAASARQLRRIARREEGINRIREMKVTCPRGCIVSQHGNGGGDALNSIAMGFLNKSLLYLQEHVNAKLAQYKEYMQTIIDSANSKTGRKLEGCGKAAFEGWAETKYLMDAGEAGVGAIAVWAGARCAISWFS